MEQAGAFRHELKYALSLGDELALRRRIRAVIPHDAHAGPDGRYRIRSIYFDNIYDKALREKIDGVQKRENSASGTITTIFRISCWKRRSSITHCARSWRRR